MDIYNWNCLEANAEKLALFKMRGVKKRSAPGRVAFKRRVKMRRQKRMIAFAGAFGEVKFHDVDLDDAVIGGAAITASINLIAQGITEKLRIGRKCRIVTINWRFDINLPEVNGGTDAPSSDITRVIMFWDKSANKATAAVTDILEASDYQSFRNLTNSGRFVMLMDRTYSLNYLTGIGTAADQDYSIVNQHDTFFKKVNIPIEFTADTGAITEITNNNIGVLLLNKAGVSGFASKIRLRFTDY